MAILLFRGDAEELLQVDTITVGGTWATADTPTVTLNGKTGVVTLGTDTTTAQVALALQEMLSGTAQTGTGDHTFTPVSAQVIPEFAEITFTVSGNVITMTAKTERPFTFTSTDNSTSGTLVNASVTVANGPSHLTLENFAIESTGVNQLPTTGDTVIFRNTAQSLLYVLETLVGVLLAKVQVELSYTGEIGLAQTNQANTSLPYFEYRERDFTAGITSLIIGEGDGRGSGRLQFDVEATACAADIQGTGTSADRIFHAVQLKGSSTSNTLLVKERSTVDLLTGNWQIITATGASAVVRGAEDVGVTTVRSESGALVDINSAASISVDSTGGSEIVYRKGTLAILNALSGIVSIENVAPLVITKLNLGAATLDLTNALADVTFTDADAKTAGSTIADPNARSIWSNAIDLGETSLTDHAFDFGPGRTILPT